MNPADQAMVQRYLDATLAKVAEIKKNFEAAKASLEQQEKALYAAAGTEKTPAVAPAKSPSILDGDVDMTRLNDALQKLTGAGDCDCPNVKRMNFLPPMPEGT